MDDINQLTAQAHVYETTARPHQAAMEWQKISALLVAQKRINEGLSAARRAANLQPLTAELQNDLAELCWQNDRPTEAVRVWGNYARQLCDQQLYEDALITITHAQKKIPRHDTLMLIEAEILAAQDGYRRRQKIFRRSTNLSGGLIIFAMVLLTAFGVYDYVVRERLLRACHEANQLMNNVVHLPPAEKLTTAQSIIDKLHAAQPYWNFMTTATYRESLQRARAYQEKLREQNSE